MNKYEGGFEKKEKKNEGLSAGWKATGAITLGLMLGGKLFKLGPLGNLNNKEIKEMERQGGWIAAVVKKSAEVYTGFEEIEKIADEHDFKEECRRLEEAIGNTELAEDKQRLENEYNQMKKNRASRLKKEHLKTKTMGKIFGVIKGIAGW